ncbi:MAG: transporter substrate-binding domain-containing protein [Deltaproteobacteria bacterium]|nr:transporter substrate-binding domain-containing protein [Deltaproteobacteria bacterium]
MKKLFLCILAWLFYMIPAGIAGADDFLTPQQRAWITNHGTIKVGMSQYYPPITFMDKLGEPQGTAVDFWRLLSAKLQFWVQFYPDLFENQFKGVRSGKYDSIGAVFALPERKPFFDFTKPYTTVRTCIYVKPRHAKMKNLSDIKELKVAVVSGDSGEVLARKAGLNPSSLPTYREAVFNLSQGDADALIMDEPVVSYFIKKFDLQKKVVRVGEPVDEDQSTLPVRKGNAMLLGILNRGIDLVTKGEWAEIERRWLGESRPMK